MVGAAFLYSMPLLSHGALTLVTQELVDASFELGVQDVWVVHGGGLQV